MKNIIIVDIDGTIAKVGDRLKYLKESPKNWDAFYDSCFDDEPIMDIVDLVTALEVTCCEIVFCTGRRESTRHVTEQWIEKHFYKLFKYSKLLMRPNKDHRHDTECKIEQCEKAGIDFNNIKFVLEDRDSMVKKWRSLGVKVLQVAEGDF